MKVYRNSIYIFILISMISLYMAYHFDGKNTFVSNVLLGIFGSSLIALFSSVVFYFNEKERIIISLATKCSTIYGILKCFLDELNNKFDNTNFEQNIKYIEGYCKTFGDNIARNSIQNELMNYSGVLSYTLFYKMHCNKELGVISSLWTMQQNLIVGNPSAINLLNSTRLGYELALLENKTELALAKKQECLNIIENLKKNIPLQMDFISQMLDFLFKYKLFNKTWNELKKELDRSN